MTGKSRISKVTGKVVTDYVDKKKFTEDIHQYVIRQKQRELEGLPKEKMPNSIGSSIIKIVEGIGKRSNFRNYTYIDEMIGDAIVACVAAVHKFDPEKSDNAFGFMSFCAWNVFLNRIQLEKKIQTGKESLMLDNTYLTSELGEYADEFDINREDSINMYWSGK